MNRNKQVQVKINQEIRKIKGFSLITKCVDTEDLLNLIHYNHFTFILFVVLRIRVEKIERVVLN